MPKKLSLIFFLLFSVLWFACKKVDINFGDQFLDNGYTQIVSVDTFAPDVSTIYVDSFPTSASGVSLIGNYTDPVFGKITTTNYFEVIPPSYVQSVDYVDSLRNVVFDSIAFVFKPNHTYSGDTTQPIHINVNRLAEPIVPYDNSFGIIYNTRSFAVQPTVVGSGNYLLRPYSADSFTVRLNDNLGKELIKKFQDPNDGDVRTNDAFLRYIFGFKVSADANSKLIFGTKDSVVLRLFYKKPGLFLTNRTLDFTLNNSSHQFNNISVDRSGTVLANLPTVKQISSTALANTAYSMYAAGAVTKIRFPSIRDVFRLPNFAKVLKATLIVRPVRGTYGGTFALPPQLKLSQTTILNQLGVDLTSINSSGQSTTQTGNFVLDNLYGENTSYEYDLTSYIKTIMQDATINYNGLLLIPTTPALTTQFGRLITGNHYNTAGKMDLVILYASVQ